MKTYKFLIRMFFLVFLMSMSLFAVTLDTDDFNTSNSEGWSGGSIVSNAYKISTSDTATKIFSFPAYANKAVTLTLTADSTGYDSGETYIITINGLEVANRSTDATLSFNAVLNASGEMNVTVKSNANSSSESVTIDSISLITGSDYSIDHFRKFNLVNQNNLRGDMQIIGNSVMRDTGNVCPDTTKNNNDLNPVWANLNTDGNASIYNSTSADLTLPAGVDSAKIKYAALYWQGRVASGDTFTEGKTVLFKPQGISTYKSVTSLESKFNWSIRASDKSYQGIADVTDLVKQSIDTISAATIASTGYSGTIWTANILAKQMSNGFGAWSLVVVYDNPSDTLKNISVYDGYQEVTGSNTISVPLSGFLTPKTSPVNSKFIFFGGEGDISLNDSISLTNKTGSDISLGTNVFNSSETNASGSNIMARNPSCQNTIGIDIHTVNIGTNGSPAIIGTEQTATTVKLKADGDTYYPGVFAFSTDLYEPDVCYIENIFKGTTNISGVGAKVDLDDNLTVRVYIKNKGNEKANGVQIHHQFDSSFPYVAGSANYHNNNPGYEVIMPPTTYTRVSATDSSGNDLYEYNSTSLLSKINLGGGATASTGGEFNTTTSANPTYAVYEYNAIVKNLDTNYSNVYKAGYVNSILGVDFTNNPVTIYSCNGTVNSFWGYSATPIVTGADIIDTFTSIANYNNGTDKVIQTKVVSKPNVTITGVHLDSSGQAAAYTPSNPDWQYSVIPYWSDGTCSTQENVLNTSGSQVVIDIPSNQTAATAQITTKAKAVKNARFKTVVVDPATLSTAGQSCIENSSTSGNFARVAQCANSEVQYTTAFGTNAWNRCGLGGGKPCEPSNHGAANPSEPTYNPLYASELGCYICTFDLNPSCSSDNFAIRPNEFSSTITANQIFIAKQPSAITFRANQFAGTGTTDYNEIENTSFVADMNISDITKVCAQSSMNFTPNIAFTNGAVSANYTLPNVGDFSLSIHEKPGSEYALVDADDTTDANRYITPFNQQIKVIPDHFTVDGNLTNGSNGFTYLSNFEAYPTAAGRQVSALLDLNITAQAADDTNLSNYTSTCYAKDGNVTLTLGTALNIAPLTKMIWYDQNHDLNGSRTLGGTSYPLGMFASQFNSPTNGMASVRYRLNFDRNETQTINPFTMNVTNVAARDLDNVNGGLALNSSINYRYGRIIPRDVRVFGSVPYTANGWYEVYNSPLIGTTALPVSRNDSIWNINLLHNDVNDGDANVTSPTGVGNGTAVSGVESYNFGASATVPFSTKAHIRTGPWLWYGANALPYSDPGTDCLTHPCFNITIVPAVGATGSARTGAGTEKGSKTTNSNGWKTTNDYAPAVR